MANIILRWVTCMSLLSIVICADIILDGTQQGRVFDGIGGLSGGGATSRFLFDYEEPYQSEILDYLFKPNFGAALQILKVEIGGDDQTTEGTEPSHMHNRDDLNYQRGYEWKLMVEAKKRNPDILLYALSWSIPAWVASNGTFFTEDNIAYHIKWLEGARNVYNLEIDVMGIWNERSYNADWAEDLRQALDDAGFKKTKLAAADGNWNIVDDLVKDKKFAAVIDIVGVHYPGTGSPDAAKALSQTLWASEDYSSYSDSTGGGCWGRILNQNYVNGLMTATISWNLVSAYYNTVPYGGDGLMWAANPWSGHYDVQSPIWISAHTTQFTKPGWIYLAHDSGVGHLPAGGSYVTLVPPDNTDGDFSLIIETFTHDHSICVRPGLSPYTVVPQEVTFQVGKGLNIKKPLYVWKTHLNPSGDNSYFTQIQTIDVSNTNGEFKLELDLDSVFTVSTLSGQAKGQYPAPPAEVPFPNSYADSFEDYPMFSEARYWSDQQGSWEINTGVGGTKVMRQVVTEAPPLPWCGFVLFPISVFGKFTSGDIVVTVDALIESAIGSVNVGARVVNAGCSDIYGDGYWFSVAQNGGYNLTSGRNLLASGKLNNFTANTWVTLTLSIFANKVCASANGRQLACVDDTNPRFGGFSSIGSGWNFAQFKNFMVKTVPGKGCPSEGHLTLDICDDGQGKQQWSVEDDGTVELVGTSRCLTIGGGGSDYTWVRTAPCNHTDPNQQWAYKMESLVSASGKCVDIKGANSALCGEIGVWDCSGSAAQQWGFSNTGQIVNIYQNPGFFCLTEPAM